MTTDLGFIDTIKIKNALKLINLGTIIKQINLKYICLLSLVIYNWNEVYLIYKEITMKNFMIIAMSGIVGIALTACGGGSSSSGGGVTPPPVPNDVNYTALTSTGTNGYKVTVDINGSVGGVVDVYSGIEYYFCTNSIMSYDYFAVTPTGSDYNGSYEPDFDYGWTDINGQNELVFTPDSGNITGSAYTINEDTNQTLTEGQTYSLWMEGQAGTVTVNTISDFNCTTIQ